ncbi:flavonol sulfotransferase-like protein [Trifolium pratense]|uniref:Flavonol sulfotransferase-like protein n=1 Tax=Trifolium pratense TaxID=57577 RepID=A0A2K3NQA5_TRIPR|nr:flavonol sulfotransferase-like protein [Trifolium pratense]
MQKTLAIIKPDGLLGNYTDDIKRTILEYGFNIVKEKIVQLDDATVKRFYAEHSSKSFFSNLVKYMTSNAVNLYIMLTFSVAPPCLPVLLRLILFLIKQVCFMFIPATVLPLSPSHRSWARSMRRALGGKMKFDFVDSSIPVPIDPFDPSLRAWSRCNMLVHSWILNSVSESIAQSIMFMENAIDVWNDLKGRFSQGDLVRISELQQEIYSLRQESRSVTEFFSALKVLWEEFEIYLPIPMCTCRVKCSCEAMRSAHNNHNLMYVIRFLTGLNDHFDVVKSQILIMDPLPPLYKIFSMLIQHERQGNFAPSEDSKALINAANSKTSGSKNFKSSYGSSSVKRVCTFCGKDNHIIDNCYKKHGYSCNWGRDCDGDSVAASEPKTAGSAPMTQDQWERLIALIQNSPLNQSSIPVSSNQC